MLDPVIRDLARGKNFGSISFHLPNDAIATHVMWVDADDEHVLINTEVHRWKYKAMQADKNVTVTIWSSENPYAYAEVRGTVTGEIRGPEARDGIDALVAQVHRWRLFTADPERAGDPADHSEPSAQERSVI